MGLMLLLSVYHRSAAQTACSARTQPQCAGDCEWVSGACRDICYRSNTAYTPDMQGTATNSVTAQQMCKERCQNQNGCAHFTFYPLTGKCHLQDASAVRQAANGAVSGEPGCVEASSTSTGSSGSGVSSGNSGSGASSGSSGSRASSGSFGSGASSGSSGSGASSGSIGSGAGSATMPAGLGNGLGVESMPGNLGAVMRIGSADATSAFSGLSAVQSRGQRISGEGNAGVQTLAVVSTALVLGALVGALVAASRSRQRQTRTALESELAVE